MTDRHEPGEHDADGVPAPVTSTEGCPVHDGANASVAAPAATIRVDAAGTIVGWDAGAKDVYGLAEDEVLGLSLRDLTLEMNGLLTSAQARAARNEAVARSEARFRALVQHSSDLVSIIDRSLTITFVSPSVVQLLGVPPSATLGRIARTVVHPEDRSLFDALMARVLDHPDLGPPTSDVRLLHADGEWRTFELVTTNLLEDPAVAGIVINGRDVTDRRRSDVELRHRATHDALTDLATRSRFIDELAGLLDSSDRGEVAPPSGPVAVVAIGIDRFQTINDSLGHHAGDQVLVTTAHRLLRAAPPGALVARVGGDTFVAAAPVGSQAESHRLAHALIDVLREPVKVSGRRIAVAARAGVALSDADSTAANLLRHADAALHRAKAVRAEAVTMFDTTFGDEALRRLEVEQALPDAVANDELRIHLQPIVSTHDAVPIGVEALVRWEHPTLGRVAPLDFIPLAEDTGDIIEIGQWVLHRSCQLLAAWNRYGQEMRLSVNLSPRQFLAPGFVDQVRRTLDTTGFDPGLLTLEVTESVLVEEGPAAMTPLEELRDLGISLAIDDFGTGYSSLVYLRRLRVDTLKIDKSFIDGLADGSDDDTIVRTIIHLASSLGLGVVAEGVETEEQRARLIAHGCPHAQGYLFAPPLEPERLRDRYIGPTAENDLCT
jgi:diguanylate cyclase (GGDEF)-like protein/PAS domain S-box-containing protein